MHLSNLKFVAFDASVFDCKGTSKNVDRLEFHCLPVPLDRICPAKRGDRSAPAIVRITLSADKGGDLVALEGMNHLRRFYGGRSELTAVTDADARIRGPK